MTENLPFIERDISWLHFNGRVLQEAKDPSVPLYERLKFLAIYSSNLDEFFRVRVAAIRSFRKLAKSTRKEMHLRPKRLLREIRQLVQEQQAEFGHTFREIIKPELISHGIHLIRDEQFDAAQRAFAERFFQEKIGNGLQWVPLEKKAPPFLEDRLLYLIVVFEDGKLALVTIPDLDRFVVLPSSDDEHYVTFIDDIVRVGLSLVFPDKTVTGAYSVKMSRDAEMYIDDEYSGDLLEKIKKGLKERDVGLPTRFLYDSLMPEAVYQQMKSIFKLTKNDFIPGARYHNFNDFFGFPDPIGLPELHNEPLPPLPHPKLEGVDDLMAAMSERDFLLHFPYQKFNYVTRFIEQAANDPKVEYIKVTLYRVASKSAVGEALLRALENGKKVYVFIEAKARFDEESNLFWGNKLSEAGATVRYSFPGIKVHTKLLLVGRRKGKTLRHYVYLATGNFNEKTAELYSDLGLLTTDARLADEAARVFEVLEGRVILPRTKDLFVAPFTLREKFVKLIDKEIENARKGKEAWMILKMNSLEDEPMMRRLIKASQAGVKIRMIVRGICCLQPGLPGQTENIEVISIVDRFLEHARVYIFCAGGKEKMYLASADWMNRNLSRRVEVAFPVFEKKIKEKIRQIIDLQLADNVKARVIDAECSNGYVQRSRGEVAVRAQLATYEFFKK